MEIAGTVDHMQSLSEEIRCKGERLGLVPTMGDLHEGHASLIRKSVEDNGYTAVSIFVNPTQFGPEEDFETYPRDFERDRQICEDLGADIVFHPEVSEMYGENSSTSVEVGGLTAHMCGASRPGHFEGVATVVAKLFNIVNPTHAYFGQKDYQQFKIIEKMVDDLNFNLELVMCSTVREKDGLAVSSRNRYLDRGQRVQAASLYRALSRGADLISTGRDTGIEDVSKIIYDIINDSMTHGGIDYAGVFDAQRLVPAERTDGELLIAAAVRLGHARLIDNILVKR